MPKTPGTWDYVIVGAGTAGCLLAIAERGSDMIREDRKRLP
jgi:choline dehydrogenase-like flavoprotein